MNAIKELCELLTQKRDRFMQYEKETAALLTCDIQQLKMQIKVRQKIADEIDQIDESIAAKLQEHNKMQKQIKDAMSNRCARQKLPVEFQPVFDLAQQTFAVIHRVGRMESNAQDRIKHEQVVILGKIKQLNRSSTAKASKYYTTSTAAHSNQYVSFHSKKA